MGTEADSAVPSWKPEAGVVPVGTLGNSEEPSPGGPPAAEVRKVPSVGRSALLSEGAAGPGVPWGRTPREERREAVYTGACSQLAKHPGGLGYNSIF